MRSSYLLVLVLLGLVTACGGPEKAPLAPDDHVAAPTDTSADAAAAGAAATPAPEEKAVTTPAPAPEEKPAPAASASAAASATPAATPPKKGAGKAAPKKK
jgi:hypothetical protein